MFRRPSYHITAPRNWLNDPNGPIHHEGRYHVFYQYNPDAPQWGPPHWGHVSSPDLVHWDRHPVALSPTGQGPDADGIWSGCARHVDGHVSLFYTGVVGTADEWHESVCRADGFDDLTTWTRSPDNPLITGPPDGLATIGHRDPFLYDRPDGWGMLLGAGVRADTPQAAGAVLNYHSADLRTWEYRGLLFDRPASAPGLDTAGLWECPQLVHIDDRDVLILSIQDPTHPRPLRYVVYAVGEVVDDRFHPESLGRVDHGETFYAAAVTTDGQGRHLMWGWLQEDPRIPTAQLAPHAGALSLPRELRLDGDRLIVAPAAELRHVGKPVSPDDHGRVAHPDRPLDLGVPGHHFLLNLPIPADTLVDVELTWQNRPKQVNVLRVDTTTGRMLLCDFVDGRVVARPGYTADLSTAKCSADVSVYVDTTILEVFASDGTALTARLPRYEEPPSVHVSTNRPLCLDRPVLRVLPPHGIVG